MKIAVDVTSIPSRGYDGTKRFFLELLRGFTERSRSDQFVFLTSAGNHEFFLELERLGMSRLCTEKSFSPPKPSLLRRIFNRLKSEITYMLPGTLKKEGASVLFCPMTTPSYAETGIPTVSLVHDAYDLEAHPNECATLKRKADFIICSSSTARERVIEKLKIPQERVFNIPVFLRQDIGIPSAEDATAILAKFDLQGKVYCIFETSLHPCENHRMLLVAFSMFIRRYPEHRLHLVLLGVGRDADLTLEDAVKQMGLQGRVHFLSAVSADEATVIWSCAHSVVFPNLSGGLGLPIAEALMYDKPLLSSNAADIPEMAGGGAIYFDPRKLDDMVAVLHSILENGQLYSVLIKKGKEKHAEWDFARMVDGYLSVLHKAALHGPAASYIDVSGVYSDGWAGPSVGISFGPAKHTRVLDLVGFMPEWHPHETCTIEAAFSDGAFKRYSLMRNERLRIRQTLPECGGAWSINISGGFIPGSPDERTLALLIEDMFITEENTGETIYDFRK